MSRSREKVDEGKQEFLHQLKFCANSAFPFVHHLHLLHLNRTRHCNKLKNLHLDGMV
jgi:hypothetical protein